MREATQLRKLLTIFLRVSIHASHAGGDKGMARAAALELAFQSTPPMREATDVYGFDNFYTRFQSTPPMREATYAEEDTDGNRAVSIHASHAGGDE